MNFVAELTNEDIKRKKFQVFKNVSSDRRDLVKIIFKEGLFFEVHFQEYGK